MLTDDGSYTLRDCQLDETYHSGCGALAECLHVYLRNSGIETLLERRGVEHRLSSEAGASERDDDLHAGPVRVLEFGFGTGMACLLTMTAAYVHGCPLEYESLEHALLPVEVLSQLRIGEAVQLAIARGDLPATYAVASRLEQAWLEFRASLPATPRSGEFIWQAGPASRLRLIIGDAVEYASAECQRACPLFDAIYFDAFSPATNPGLWSEPIFSTLSRVLQREGRLVSYCVSGAVRRGLERAGFRVERLPGPPGGKREVLLAQVR